MGLGAVPEGCVTVLLINTRARQENRRLVSDMTHVYSEMSLLCALHTL